VYAHDDWPIEIHRTARLLIEAHGEVAVLVALLTALRHRKAGKEIVANVWLAVASTIDYIEQSAEERTGR
jgi:hypothetical protein